jgi:hypothetical protein
MKPEGVNDAVGVAVRWMTVAQKGESTIGFPSDLIVQFTVSAFTNSETVSSGSGERRQRMNARLNSSFGSETTMNAKPFLRKAQSRNFRLVYVSIRPD